MTRRARPTVTRDRDDQRRRRGGAGPRPSGRGRPSPVKVVRTRALHLDRGGTARSGRTCVTGRPAPRTDHDSDRPGRAKQWTPQAVMPRRLGPEIIRFRSGTTHDHKRQQATSNVGSPRAGHRADRSYSGRSISPVGVWVQIPSTPPGCGHRYPCGARPLADAYPFGGLGAQCCRVGTVRQSIRPSRSADARMV